MTLQPHQQFQIRLACHFTHFRCLQILKQNPAEQAAHRNASSMSPSGCTSHPGIPPSRHSHDPGLQRLQPGPVGTSSTMRYNADTFCHACLPV